MCIKHAGHMLQTTTGTSVYTVLVCRRTSRKRSSNFDCCKPIVMFTTETESTDWTCLNLLFHVQMPEQTEVCRATVSRLTA